MFDFEKLTVYQKAKAFNKEISCLASQQPKNRPDYP